MNRTLSTEIDDIMSFLFLCVEEEDRSARIPCVTEPKRAALGATNSFEFRD